MLATQRRLERKLKELNMTLDEERQHHSEHRDQVITPLFYTVFVALNFSLKLLICFLGLQLALKVKALKRQVDEGETELERIDNLRRKAQREMEEQTELKEALQTRVTVLETELKYVSFFPVSLNTETTCANNYARHTPHYHSGGKG